MASTELKIVVTLAGQLFRVTEPASADLAHCYDGVQVFRRGGEWLDRKGGRSMLVRKEGCRVLETEAA